MMTMVSSAFARRSSFGLQRERNGDDERQRSEDGQIAHEERSTTQDNDVLRHGARKEFAAGRPIGKIRVHLEDL